MALDRKLKEATSEELISLVKRQSSKLKTMEKEYSELKQKVRKEKTRDVRPSLKNMPTVSVVGCGLILLAHRLVT